MLNPIGWVKDTMGKGINKIKGLYNLTLKQLNTIRLLPKNKYIVSKAMVDAGYTESTSKNGTQITKLRNIAMSLDCYSPDAIKQDGMKVFDKAESKERLDIMQNNVEWRSKVAGMLKNENINTNLNIEIDNTSDEPENLTRLARIKVSKN